MSLDGIIFGVLILGATVGVFVPQPRYEPARQQRYVNFSPYANDAWGQG